MVTTPVTNDQILTALYAVAPQFNTTDATILGVYAQIIGYLRAQVNEQILGASAVLAYAYLLAHMLMLRANPSTGIIASMSEGELSVNYSISPDSDILVSTSYGKAYKDLVKRKVFAPFVTRGRAYGCGGCFICGPYIC